MKYRKITIDLDLGNRIRHLEIDNEIELKEYYKMKNKIDELQQENEKLKEENTTLIKNQINSNSEHFRIIKENKRKIDNLRNQVKVLHESIIKSAKNTNKSIELTEIYKSRCEKAIEYINHYLKGINNLDDVLINSNILKEIDVILNGSDENE